jgi:hypothetical protein
MRVGIQSKDQDYAHALASAFALRMKDCEVAVVPPAGSYAYDDRVPFRIDGVDLLISYQTEASGEGIMKLPRYEHINEICEMAREYLPDPDNSFLLQKGIACELAGFTSGSGGAGTSSAALTMGRLVSRLTGLKTAYVSFAPFCYNGVREDEYGLVCLPAVSGKNPLAESDAGQIAEYLRTNLAGFDRAVLDVPYSHPCSGRILAMCERNIVVVAPRPEGDRSSEYIAEMLLRLASEQEDREVFVFRPEYDPGSFSKDGAELHSSYGTEVRRLARELGYV